jgi:phosphohistidine phosphatase
MKTLLLMRHGKSDWKDTKDDDKMRPLTKKGGKDVRKMGEMLIEKGYLPQVVLTSTALRARQTAEFFLSQCCQEVTISARDVLYMAEPTAIVDAIKTVGDEVEKVMIIGHNPGLEGLFQQLSGKVESLSTANVAWLDLPIDHWADLTVDSQPEKWHKWKPKDAD